MYDLIIDQSHLHISNLITKLYIFIRFYWSYFPLMWISFHAKVNEITCLFSYSEQNFNVVIKLSSDYLQGLNIYQFHVRKLYSNSFVSSVVFALNVYHVREITAIRMYIQMVYWKSMTERCGLVAMVIDRQQ